MNVLIVYYSMYGHIRRMAEAVKEGADGVSGATVRICRVPETLPEEVLKKMGALETQKEQAHVPICNLEDLVSADAIIFGTPTRFGNMCGQDASVSRCHRRALVQRRPCRQSGKRLHLQRSATQHGGQESTILSFHITLLHQGMIIVGLPYSFAGQMRIDEMTGSSPYGASTIAGVDGKRMPSKNELDAARFQGKHVAEIATKLVR
jgi:NAD(P)H dehydrogenase (quinone)